LNQGKGRRTTDKRCSSSPIGRVFRGEPVDEDKRGEDEGTIERRARVEGTDLENEAHRAKEKLMDVNRPRK
jgi:hypothetical protein